MHRFQQAKATSRFVWLAAAMLPMVLLCDPAVAAKSKFNRVVSVGDAAAEWGELPGVDGKMHTLAEYKNGKAVVVIFIANRCPTFKIYESRVIDFAKTYGEK